MFSKQDQIQGYDDALMAAINAEEQRQEDHIELIASENYTSKRVMQAQGSGLTNKYAEGYPGKRYYGGCEHVDKVEALAIERAKQLFGADYANVQPHSGSSANGAVYLALLQAGDTILGMSLAHGGHLTHGARAPGGRAQAEDDCRRFLRLLENPRFPTFPSDCRQGRCTAVRRHGPRRRPGRSRSVPEPDPLRRRGHHHTRPCAVRVAA